MAVGMATMAVGVAAVSVRVAARRCRMLVRAAVGLGAMRLPCFVVFVMAVRLVMMFAAVPARALDLMAAEVAAVVVAMGWGRRRRFGRQAALFA